MGDSEILQTSNSKMLSDGKILRIVLLVAGIQGLAAVFLIGQTRSSEGGVLLGLFEFRLALAGVILLISVLFLIMAWRWQPGSHLADRLERFLLSQRTWLALVFFWLGVLFFLLWLEPDLFR